MKDMNGLLKQQQIVVMREQLIRDAKTPQDKLHAEEAIFRMMRDASPEFLAPVLVRRNNADYVAAYLVQKIGVKAWRFLVTGEKWQIFRAKKSADVIKIPSEVFNLFRTAVMAQGAANAVITRLKNAIKDKKHVARENIHAGQAGGKIRPGLCESRPPRLKRQTGKS